MAATYKIQKCISCGKTSKTERAYEGLQLGNPLYHCQHCRAINYDKNILEPALLNPEVLLKDGRKRYNTFLLLLYIPLGLFAFFALSIALENFFLGFLIVSPILALLTVLILKKKKQVSIQDYEKIINESLNRLESDFKYAQLIIQIQGNDAASAWSRKHGNQMFF